MKTIIAALLLSISSISFAEVCTSVIVERGIERESFTREAYNRTQACYDADWDCRSYLYDQQRLGRYMMAFCQEKFQDRWPVPPRPPVPPRTELTCRTDLVDMYGVVFRTFTEQGRTQAEACEGSDQQCKYELARSGGYGMRCVNKGISTNPFPTPRPPRNRTESCIANRYDPAGMYIQSYSRTASGSYETDVKALACQMALRDCQMDLKGRQYCDVLR